MCVTLDPFQVLFMQSNEACIVCLHPIADVMMTWGECLLAWGEGQIWREKCYGGTKNGKFNLGGPGLLGGPWIMMGVPPTLDETMPKVPNVANLLGWVGVPGGHLRPFGEIQCPKGQCQP